MVFGEVVLGIISFLYFSNCFFNFSTFPGMVFARFVLSLSSASMSYSLYLFAAYIIIYIYNFVFVIYSKYNELSY